MQYAFRVYLHGCVAAGALFTWAQYSLASWGPHQHVHWSYTDTLARIVFRLATDYAVWIARDTRASASIFGADARGTISFMGRI